MYITKTIMKFMVLDKGGYADDASAIHYKNNTHTASASAYQHLDDLLDKTFITDYFMDRSAAASEAAEK